MGIQSAKTDVQGAKFYEKASKMGKMGGFPGREECGGVIRNKKTRARTGAGRALGYQTGAGFTHRR